MNIIEQIKEKINIKDLCRIASLEIVNNKIRSIYRDERTPSLHIYDNGLSFKDYSSGASGDVIDFYMQLYNLDKKTAIKQLADIAKIDKSELAQRQAVNLPPIEKTDHLKAMSDEERFFYEERAGISDEKQALYETRLLRLHRNSQVFEEMYNYCGQYQNAEMFNNYMQVQRSIHPDFINKFKLFYIGNYFEVNNHLKKKFDLSDLRRCGLFNDKGNLIFAMHRIVIPYLSN
ncbi:MAG: hypothetical protein LC136_08000, partial [Burkholderiales bacterium]|nr:hypothetical protein [Burkholderiales bacterium]